MSISEDILNTPTDEQKKKVGAARPPEELLALAKESGYELSPEQPEAVAGGWHPTDCHSYDMPANPCLP